MPSKPNYGRSVRIWIIANYPAALAGLPILVIPALEWVPGLPTRARAWLVVSVILIAAVGFIINLRRNKNIRDLEVSYDHLRGELLKTKPSYFLHQVATSLFRQGAWRIAVYQKHLNDGVEELIQISSAASDSDNARLGPQTIEIQPGTLFALTFQSNLSDPRFRRAIQSGPYSDDVLSDNWIKWRNEIFGTLSNELDRSQFRARKYAWLAAQEPSSTRVFVVIAESTSEEGITVDLLDHPLTPSWMFFVSHLAQVQSSA
ncbi:hypothetical protein SAMN06265174_101537 [Dietzia kunjamensis subsp. schimae]|uniref:Uncharacterized protein n=1 Tax=Dietzia kunjamensis subsp. schimae TaxID=498198 RepID=A0ABY1MZM7_9ACTN|nr:hypothetical protein [Dietzia kunjamensis]MBB1014128.1 hypothetical protein [Dietzia kunjamensis subsp. schimae]SMO42364.1 hypothetical protein SAMN06265174_101537 [Dietzia kunjamensis subsp. schimae]